MASTGADGAGPRHVAIIMDGNGRWAQHGELDHHRVEASVEELIEKALEGLPETCHIVIMSNGGFGGIHRKLVAELEKRRG